MSETRGARKANSGGVAKSRSVRLNAGPASHRRVSGPGIARGLRPDLVLDAAEEILARRGLAAFRIRDVSDALDVQPQAIYNYFAGREELIRAVSERFTRGVVEAMSVPHGTSPWDEVRESARNLAGYFCSRPSAAYLVLADMEHWNLSRSGRARDIDLAYQRHLKELLGAGRQAGLFRAIRHETYLSYVIIGIAANVLWNERHGNLNDRTAVACHIIQQEAVDLVVALLAPS